MKFGKVSGMLLPTIGGTSVTILLELGSESRVIRDEVVAPELMSFAESEHWLVDQLVQEALGTDLAEEGWEVVAVSADAAEGEGITSPVYTVRKI